MAANPISRPTEYWTAALRRLRGRLAKAVRRAKDRALGLIAKPHAG